MTTTTTTTTTNTTSSSEEDNRPFWETNTLELAVAGLAFLVSVVVLLVIACVCTRRRKRKRKRPAAAATASPAQNSTPSSAVIIVHHDTPVPKPTGGAQGRAEPNQYVKEPHSTSPRNAAANTKPRPSRQQSESDKITDLVGKDLVKESMIDIKRLKLKEVIGSGSFGLVRKGILLDQDMRNPQTVAVKTVNEDSSSQKGKQDFVKEALRMKGFKHKNVMCMLAITWQGQLPLVILPFMEYGDLKTFLGRQDRTFTVKYLVELAIQVAEGMVCLAENNYVHRDLAARNCLVDSNCLVKIADFGLVRDLHSDDYYVLTNLTTPLPVKWMALESITQKKFSLKTDVWSYGILLWEIHTRGQKPYPGLDNAQVIKFIKAGKRMTAPPKCPDSVYNLMLRCWSAQSSKRPQFTQIVRELRQVLTTGTTHRDSRVIEDYYIEPLKHAK